MEAAQQSFTLRLGNGRVIESSYAFVEEELARLIRVAERVTIRVGAGYQNLHRP